MTVEKRLDRVFENAEKITFNNSSKIILISDCHRGDGSWSDDFAENQVIYDAAITKYFDEGYTYIEIGDGDDLWEYKNPKSIVREHHDTFKILADFYKENRFYMIFGNHDIRKKKNNKIMRDFYSFYDETAKKRVKLFENIKVHEGIVLKYQQENNEKNIKDNLNIFLIHGHQADFLNYNLWRLSEFLVRNIWKRLELIGVKDPVSPAKNVRKKNEVESKLINWAKKNNQILIVGHTHKPSFPVQKKSGQFVPYFNDGSCVHPRGITGIEIVGGEISLIKWSLKTKRDGVVFADKDILAGPIKLTAFSKKI